MTKTSRRQFLRRAAVVPFAGAALALGVRPHSTESDGVTIRLNDLVPADGHWHKVTVELVASRTPTVTALSYVKAAADRPGKPWRQVLDEHMVTL